MPGLLPLLLQALVALDQPSGVVAVVHPDAQAQRDPGGNAVVIDTTGHAISLAESLPDGDRIQVLLAHGQRRLATVVARDAASTGVLLRITDLPASCQPLIAADPTHLPLGSPVWSVGNAAGAMQIDGQPAWSSGRITAFYDIPDDAAPVRGRFGRELSGVHGAVFETDAAINDGNEGGAVLDRDGRLIGLATRSQVRARRLPTVVPITRILAGLGRSAALPPAAADPGWSTALSRALPSLALVYLERPQGPGNPPSVPRPQLRPADAPVSERERLQNWWDAYYHQRQIFFSDQPITAVAVSDTELLTSASNLHGGALGGRLLGPTPLACTVVAVDAPVDLALLRCASPHGLAPIVWSEGPLQVGDAVAVAGRHDASSGPSLAIGVVSATPRLRDQSRIPFVQIDARTNYGSLGGPVLAPDGRAVGITVLMGPYPDRNWLINAGVALVADAATVRTALVGLRAGTSRSWAPILGLGLALEPLPDRLVVRRVLPDTGAADAKLQPGDHLLRLDGHRVTSLQSLGRILLRHRSGDRMRLDIERDGKPITLDIEAREFTP